MFDGRPGWPSTIPRVHYSIKYLSDWEAVEESDCGCEQMGKPEEKCVYNQGIASVPNIQGRYLDKNMLTGDCENDKTNQAGDLN